MIKCGNHLQYLFLVIFIIISTKNQSILSVEGRLNYVLIKFLHLFVKAECQRGIKITLGGIKNNPRGKKITLGGIKITLGGIKLKLYYIDH